jgi:diguanylate cyclase (GGDEF)-like protein
MVDVRTMFVVMVTTSILLAISLWVAVGRHFRHGLGPWTAGLVLQAVMFGLLSSRGALPPWFAIVVPNAIFPAVVSLQAAAIFEFHQKRLSAVWHVLPGLLVAILFSLSLDNYALRTVLIGVIIGSGYLALTFILHRLAKGGSPASVLMMGGYLAACVVMYGRAFAIALDPNLMAGHLLATSAVQSLSFLIAYGVVLITSVGFLLLHRERAESAAQRLALTDPLTGTFNRRIFLELAEKEIARSRRTAMPLALIMLDLDHFKRVNDRYGHLTGDAVLKRFAEIAQSCLRKEDLLVRYGGEEFCVLLPEVSLDRARVLAERIRLATEQAAFKRDGANKTISLTVSAGVSRLLDNDADDIAGLVRRADEALYSAKAAGRNRVVAYPENSTLAILARGERMRTAGEGN